MEDDTRSGKRAQSKDGDAAAAGDGGAPDTAAGVLGRLSANTKALAAVAFIAGLLLAGIVGAALAASKSNEIDDLNADLASEQEARAAAEEDRDATAQRAEAIFDRRDQIVASARTQARRIVSDARAELAELNDKIGDKRSELARTEQKLATVQASLDTAQEEKNLSSFGNGTWQANVDYLPGTYSAPGGASCYWEKLQGPSGGGINNIIENGGFNKNQIVSVDSPYFSTSGCGTWTRTG